MTYLVEEIFRTEGVPEYTFVSPPNYNELLIDIRNPTKPVVIEGQSGTGKTTVVVKMLEKHSDALPFEYLSARKAADISRIDKVINENIIGKYIIDDFHRLNIDIKEKIGDIIKIAAEEDDPRQNSKIILIGINKVGSSLIQIVHDIAKRCGIHKIKPATKEITKNLIELGQTKLHISIEDIDNIYEESHGDYWLTQLICQSICLQNNIIETCTTYTKCTFDTQKIRNTVTDRLENAYSEPVIEFCRGKRFRSTNDPYFKLLKAISEQDSSIVDITELANANSDIKGSINNIKERRLTILLESKPICERYFYYNKETKTFAIEDPALFFYMKNLDWVKLRNSCGFRATEENYEFDFAISFAGENRELARVIYSQLEHMDCSIFFDELFEANYLGKAWGASFREVFAEKSRFVVCLLDKHHLEKIWPTFERECFQPRVPDASVIPIYIDDSVFVGIPKDIIGIDLKGVTIETTDNFVTDHITLKLLEKIESI